MMYRQRDSNIRYNDVCKGRFELTQDESSLCCSIYLMHRESLLTSVSNRIFVKQNYNSDHVFEIAM